MSCYVVFLLIIRRPPRSTRTDTLFPYTTLFRSVGSGLAIDVLDGPGGALDFLVDLHRRGVIELKPGQWISAGAITGGHPIAIGQTATACFGSAATIACTATAETGFRV